MKRRYNVKINFLSILIIFMIIAYNADSYTQEVNDTIIVPRQNLEDSLRIADSLAVRMQFVRDSILVREQFVRDSIRLRQQRIDSLTFLKNELQYLLHAYFRTTKEDIILHDYNIEIAGDSVLGDFVYLLLPFSVSQPYVPWKVSTNLTGNRVKIDVDNERRKITSIQAPQVKCSFNYGGQGSILVIHESPAVQKNWAGQFYKTPFDSVFYDRYKRIVKIKRYVQFYSLNTGNQQGKPLFLNLASVKQFVYEKNNEIAQYQVVKFCDRWNAYTASKVCSIITYILSKQDYKLLMTRANDPANPYSDGTYTYEFGPGENLTSISFQNLSNTENWERTIEMNRDGNVSCYFDKTNGTIRQSLCFIYHIHDPGARYPVETIITSFEKDGISYFQKNTTTDQSRTRDKMTLEWSPWK